MDNVELKVSSPGRMCLLGEHQDYFGLAIIGAVFGMLGLGLLIGFVFGLIGLILIAISGPEFRE